MGRREGVGELEIRRPLREAVIAAAPGEDTDDHGAARPSESVLRAFHDDRAALRRYLVDEGFLARESGEYRRTGGTVDV